MRLIQLNGLIFLLSLSVRVVAVDVVGTEPGVSFHSIADYRDIIVERMAPKQGEAQQGQRDDAAIQDELIKRLGGNYPLDPTPLIARETNEFKTVRLEAPMPGAWCVIGHDEASINWLKDFASTFKSQRVSGCFLIAADDAAGFELMQAITPVPLYRVQGQSLWQIHALSYYPVVLVGKHYTGQGS